MERVHLRGARLAWAICSAQGLIGLAAASIAATLGGTDAAKATAYGALVAIVPTLYFALRVYAGRGRSEPREIVGSFYRGEIGKMALTALMFFFGVIGFGEQFLALLCGYIVCLLAYPGVWLLARID